MSDKTFHSFKEFYPFYLSEHRNKTCRLLHVIGTSLIVLLLIYVLITLQYRWLWLTPIIGYGFAWFGHFKFEKNRPATFKNPFYSFMADWVMWWQYITGQLKP